MAGIYFKIVYDEDNNNNNNNNNDDDDDGKHEKKTCGIKQDGEFIILKIPPIKPKYKKSFINKNNNKIKRKT